MKSASLVAVVLATAHCSVDASASKAPPRWGVDRGHLSGNAVSRVEDIPDEIAWERPMHSWSTSTPVILNDRVIVGDADHSIYAFSLATGKPLWAYTAGNEITGTAIVDGDLAIITEGDTAPRVWSPPDYVSLGADSNGVHAVNVVSGEQRWYYGLPGSGAGTGAAMDGSYYYFDGSGIMIALDARTGTYRWRTHLDSISATGALLATNGRVYAVGAYGNAVYAVDAKNGDVAWKRAFPPQDRGFSNERMALADGRLYGAYIRNSRQRLFALNAASGAIVWDVAAGRPELDSPDAPAFATAVEQRVILADPGGHAIGAYDQRGGAAIWRAATVGRVLGGVCVQDGIVYAADDTGRFYAFDIATGRRLGTYQGQHAIGRSSLSVVNHSIVGVGTDGVVFALPLSALGVS